MTDREKLVNLMSDMTMEITGWGDEIFYLLNPEKLADHLIDNGVTVWSCTKSEENGLYDKYLVYKIDGTPVTDRCFVLKPDKDIAARMALLTYAEYTCDEQLRNDIHQWLGLMLEQTKRKPDCKSCEHSYWHDPECSACNETNGFKYYTPMEAQHK